MNKRLFILISLTSVLAFSACNKPSKDINNDRATVQPFANTEAQMKVVAEITLKPNALESMNPVFEKVIAGSQAEEGCIYYDLHKDTADSTDTKFVMLEIWQDQAAIDAHNESQHFKTFVQTSDDYIENMKVTVLKVAK